MALDQDTLSLLQQMADSGAKPFHQMTPLEAREFLSGFRPAFGEGPEMARVEEETLGEGDAAFKVRVLVPHENVHGVIVHCHGGGWVTMSVDDFDTLGRILASKTGCAVVLVDYRLAPEFPYPSAVDDCWKALNWAASQRERLTGQADASLIVSGDSAGGNLAAVITQRANNTGEPAIALQILIYPVTQANLDGPSYEAPENQTLLSRDDMAWFWDQYLPDKSRRNEPEASPLAVEKLAGLPPAVIVVAEHDVLRDEGEAYAEKLESAGNKVSMRCFDGQMHGFLTLVNMLPASELGIDYVAEQVKKTLNKEF